MTCRTVYRLAMGLLAGFVGSGPCWSQQGYMAPNYAQANSHFYQASQIPAHMASPLAGGPTAAAGGEFVDVRGNSIVMPASYCGPAGPGGYCPPMGGGMGMGGAYGDPMDIDFGGYSEDQIGPHYFDVAFDAVFVAPQEVFSADVPAFTSYGVGAAPGVTNFPFLNPSGEGEDYQPGWRIAFRYDLGPLSVFEAAYMGIYDLDFEQTVVSSQVETMLNNQLFSIFSQYRFDPVAGIPELDQAEVQRLSYDSDLQSTELTYRRYWVGNSPRVSGTWLLGARYFRLTEDLIFSSQNLASVQGNPVGAQSGSVTFGTENDIVGFQLGGDGWVGVRQGLRIGAEGKAGVYNNRFKFNSTTTVTSTTANLQPTEDGNQVAFAAEGGVMIVADILSSWSIRGGYQVFYMNDLVKVGDNISTSQFADVPVTQPALNVDGHALYHGFNIGMEYIW